MENEPARRFRYAIGTGQRNPLIQARAWDQPVFVEPATGKTVWSLDGTASVSLFAFDSADVELLSGRYQDDAFLLRLANTHGEPVNTKLSAFAPIRAARRTTLSGNELEELAVAGGAVALTLRPWDLQQVRLELEKGHH